MAEYAENFSAYSAISAYSAFYRASFVLIIYGGQISAAISRTLLPIERQAVSPGDSIPIK